MPEKDYVGGLYGYLKSKFQNDFEMTPEQFKQKLASDSSYANGLHSFLKTEFKDDFQLDSNQFQQKVGYKMPASGRFTTELPKQPAPVPIEEKGVGLGVKVPAAQPTTSYTKVSPPDRVGKMLNIQAMPSEKPAFVDNLRQKAEVTDKILNDPTFTLMSSEAGDMNEAKRVKIFEKKNEAVAADRGYDNIQQLYSDMDESLADFLDDRQKQEYIGNRDRVQLLKQLNRAKADGQPTEDLQKKYDDQVAQFSKAKAELIVNANEEVKNLRRNLEGADPDEKTDILSQIDALEASKKDFFKPKAEQAKAIVQEAGLTEGTTDQEKVRIYAHSLMRERSDLREALGITKGQDPMIAYYSTMGADNPYWKRLQDVEDKLEAVAPVALINETPVTGTESAWGVFGKVFKENLVPQATDKGTQQEVSNNLVKGLQLSGVDIKNVKEDVYKTLEKTAKPYEDWSSKDLALMAAPTLAIMPKFIATTIITEGLGSFAAVSPYWRSIKILSERGSLGAAAAEGSLLRVMQANKYGRGLLQASFKGLEYGTQSQVETMIYGADKGEMGFVNGLVGGFLGAGAEKATKLVGKGISKVITSIFGNKAPEATGKILEFAGKVYKYTKEENGKAIGEVGEELGEDLGGMWMDSENGDEFFKTIEKHYGTPSKALKFFLSTYVMGYGFGAASKLGSAAMASAGKMYKGLSEKDRAIADNAISDMRQEQNHADVDAGIELVNESDLSDEEKAKAEEQITAQGEAVNGVIEGSLTTEELDNVVSSFEEMKQGEPAAEAKKAEAAKPAEAGSVGAGGDVETYFNENTRSTQDSKYNPDLSGEGEMALREQENRLLELGADRIQAHGLAKGSIGQQFKDLINILTKGLDSRGGGQLYTAPLVMPTELRAGAGAALGTGGGTAYTDGGFIILAREGANEIRSIDDIGGVLVNQAVADSLPELVDRLKKQFPNISIESYSNSPKAIESIKSKAVEQSLKESETTIKNKQNEKDNEVRNVQEGQGNEGNERGQQDGNEDGQNANVQEANGKETNGQKEVTSVAADALKDVNSTAKALEELSLEDIPLSPLDLDKKGIITWSSNNAKSIAKAYHRAKKEGSNLELVEAVENLLKQKENAVQESGTGEILQRQSQEAGVPGSERTGVEQGQQGQEVAEEATKEKVKSKIKIGYVDDGWSFMDSQGFDIRGTDLANKIAYSKKSFVGKYIHEGKKYITVALRLNTDNPKVINAYSKGGWPFNDPGRFGWTFATIEDDGSLPSDIENTLKEEALAKLKRKFDRIKDFSTDVVEGLDNLIPKEKSATSTTIKTKQNETEQNTNETNGQVVLEGVREAGNEGEVGQEGEQLREKEVVPPTEGATTTLPAASKYGQPREMVYKDGKWQQKIGREFTEVSTAVQKEAEAAFAVTPQSKSQVVAKGASMSSKSSIDDIKSRVTDAAKVAIINMAQKAVRTLKSVLPNFDIVVHETPGSYNESMAEVNGRAGSGGNFAFVRNADGTYSGRIDINLSAANARTVAHEVAHGIMLAAFGDKPALFNNFKGKIASALKGETNAKLEKFISSYSDMEKPEEYLAELTGYLADNQDSITPSTWQKVAAIINDIVSKLTNGAIKPFQDLKNTKEIIEFFDNISSAIREGNVIEDLNTQQAYSEGRAIEVPADFKAIKYKSQNVSKSQIGDYTFPDNIDILEISDLPIKTLEEVVRQYKGKVVLITSDATGYGVDSDGEPILGGAGFASNKINVNDGIGFASLNEGTVKGTYTRAEKAYGYGKALVLIMVQPPHTTINNSYGAKYMLRGLLKIGKLSASELEKTKNAIKNFVIKSKAVQKEFKSEAKKARDAEELKQAETEINKLKKLKENGKVLTKEQNNKIKKHDAKISKREAEGKIEEVVKQRATQKSLFELLDKIQPKADLNSLIKEFLDITTFTLRKEIGLGILPPSKETRTDVGTTYSKIAFNSINYSIYDFLKEYGDKTILTEDMMLNNKGGVLVGGFELNVTEIDQREKLIKETQSKGILHPLFNAKLPGENHFRLDGLYGAQENFGKFAVPDKVVDENKISKKDLNNLVRETFPSSADYQAEFRSLPLNERVYTHLKVTNKTKFKKEVLAPKGLLKEQDPDVATKVAKGEGFIPIEGAQEEMAKADFTSKSQFESTIESIDFENESENIDVYEASKTAEKIAKDNDVNILRGKDLRSVALNKDGDVIGGLWTELNNHEFSFDIAIDKLAQGKGVGEKLVNEAIYEFKNQDYDGNLKYKVDVTNPIMEKLLSKYGFEVVNRIAGHAIMGHPTNNPKLKKASTAVTSKSQAEELPVESFKASEEGKKAAEIAIKMETAMAKAPSLKAKQTAKLSEEIEALKSENPEKAKVIDTIVNNIDAIRAQLLEAGIIESINCKWG